MAILESRTDLAHGPTQGDRRHAAPMAMVSSVSEGVRCTIATGGDDNCVALLGHARAGTFPSLPKWQTWIVRSSPQLDLSLPLPVRPLVFLSPPTVCVHSTLNPMALNDSRCECNLVSLDSVLDPCTVSSFTYRVHNRSRQLPQGTPALGDRDGQVIADVDHPHVHRPRGERSPCKRSWSNLLDLHAPNHTPALTRATQHNTPHHATLTSRSTTALSTRQPQTASSTPAASRGLEVATGGRGQHTCT